MGKYIFSNKAVADLSSIWNYTVDEWSEKQADKYYLMLLSFCQELADDIIAGKSYIEVDNDLLGFKVGQHILIYKKQNTGHILVVIILHSRMELKNRLED